MRRRRLFLLRIALGGTAMLAVSPLSAAPRAGSAVAMRSLAGPPSAPLATGEEGFVSFEMRDQSGRLTLFGWGEAGASNAGMADQAGGGATASRGGGNAASAAGTSATPAAEVQAFAPPPTASTIGDLRFVSLSRDTSGRILSYTEGKGNGPPDAMTLLAWDASGRLVGLERREKGEVAESLSLAWDGSVSSAHLLLRDAKGEVKGGGTLVAGRGGLDGTTMDLSVVDEAGADKGGLSLAWDWGGRLVSCEIRAAPKPAETKEAAGFAAPPPAPKAGATAGGTGAGATAPDAVGNAGDSSRGIVDLLLPFWPRDAGTFELTAELLSPSTSRAALTAFADAGPLEFPFDHPKDGSIQILWDQANRPLEARLLSPAGETIQDVSFRYDARGLLAEETIESTPAKGDGKAGVGAEASSTTATDHLLFVYGVDARGNWTDCSVFKRTEVPLAGGLQPLLWFGRRAAPLPAGVRAP